jgi:hypothetical protein
MSEEAPEEDHLNAPDSGDERLPLFLLAYRVSTHEITGTMPASMVFGREPELPCDLLFGAPPDKEKPTNN